MFYTNTNITSCDLGLVAAFGREIKLECGHAPTNVHNLIEMHLLTVFYVHLKCYLQTHVSVVEDKVLSSCLGFKAV